MEAGTFGKEWQVSQSLVILGAGYFPGVKTGVERVGLVGLIDRRCRSVGAVEHRKSAPRTQDPKDLRDHMRGTREVAEGKMGDDHIKRSVGKRERARSRVAAGTPECGMRDLHSLCYSGPERQHTGDYPCPTPHLQHPGRWREVKHSEERFEQRTVGEYGGSEIEERCQVILYRRVISSEGGTIGYTALISPDYTALLSRSRGRPIAKPHTCHLPA